MTNRIGLMIVSIGILGALTACGQLDLPLPKSSENAASETPQASGESLPSSPIVAPPSYDDRPLKPGQSPQAENLPNGLPALKPLKGVNVDKLFSESISNPDRRFERVENAVVDLRKEFEVVKPAIVRLVAVEEDIQTLVQQLEILANEEAARPKPAPIAQTQLPPPETAAPPDIPAAEQTTPPTALNPQDTAASPPPPEPVTSAPTPLTTEATTETKPPPPPATGATTVQNLRTGLHSDKIRLVLDANRETAFSFDLDSEEKFLLIELPNAAWQGAKSKTFPASTPLLKSYEIESINGGKGSRIVVTLKQATTILKKQAIPPGSVSPNYRIFVDLKR